MIYITGDTHGAVPFGLHSVDGFSRRFNTEYFPEQKEMTRGDYMIICGDFGGVWNYDSRYDSTRSLFKDKICLDHGESKEEKYWLDWLSKKNFTLLFCDGNHENFDRLYHAYPEKDFHGGKAHQLRENVYHLIGGYVFNLCSLSFFVFGGARATISLEGSWSHTNTGQRRNIRKHIRRSGIPAPCSVWITSTGGNKNSPPKKKWKEDSGTSPCITGPWIMLSPIAHLQASQPWQGLQTVTN